MKTTSDERAELLCALNGNRRLHHLCEKILDDLNKAEAYIQASVKLTDFARDAVETIENEFGTNKASEELKEVLNSLHYTEHFFPTKNKPGYICKEYQENPGLDGATPYCEGMINISDEGEVKCDTCNGWWSFKQHCQI